MGQFHYNPDRLSHEPHLIGFRDFYPRVHQTVFLADGSRIIGDVEIGEHASVWYNAVIRGDVHYVRIGAGTNVQDGTVIHVTDNENPTVIGRDVTIGHSAIVHGCTLEDVCLVGMGATVLDRAVVRSESMVAAGALVPPGFEVPSGTLVAGVPAKVKRELTDEERRGLHESAEHYRETAHESMNALRGTSGEGSSSFA